MYTIAAGALLDLPAFVTLMFAAFVAIVVALFVYGSTHNRARALWAGAVAGALAVPWAMDVLGI